MLKEVELIILNWMRSIESKVDTAIIFFRKMRGIHAHAAFAPTTGIGGKIGGKKIHFEVVRKSDFPISEQPPILTGLKRIRSSKKRTHVAQKNSAFFPPVNLELRPSTTQSETS